MVIDMPPKYNASINQSQELNYYNNSLDLDLSQFTTIPLGEGELANDTNSQSSSFDSELSSESSQPTATKTPTIHQQLERTKEKSAALNAARRRGYKAILTALLVGKVVGILSASAPGDIIGSVVGFGLGLAWMGVDLAVTRFDHYLKSQEFDFAKVWQDIRSSLSNTYQKINSRDKLVTYPTHFKGAFNEALSDCKRLINNLAGLAKSFWHFLRQGPQTSTDDKHKRSNPALNEQQELEKINRQQKRLKAAEYTMFTCIPLCTVALVGFGAFLAPTLPVVASAAGLGVSLAGTVGLACIGLIHVYNYLEDKQFDFNQI